MPLSNESEVRSGLVAAGLTPNAIAALLGHIRQESSFQSTHVGDGGTSFGLFQVGRGVWNAWLSHAREHGYSPRDARRQAEYIVGYARDNQSQVYTNLINASSTREALDAWGEWNNWGTEGRRYQYAEQYASGENPDVNPESGLNSVGRTLGSSEWQTSANERRFLEEAPSADEINFNRPDPPGPIAPPAPTQQEILDRTPSVNAQGTPTYEDPFINFDNSEYTGLNPIGAGITHNINAGDPFFQWPDFSGGHNETQGYTQLPANDYSTPSGMSLSDPYGTVPTEFTPSTNTDSGDIGNFGGDLSLGNDLNAFPDAYPTTYENSPGNDWFNGDQGTWNDDGTFTPNPDDTGLNQPPPPGAIPEEEPQPRRSRPRFTAEYPQFVRNYPQIGIGSVTEHGARLGSERNPLFGVGQNSGQHYYNSGNGWRPMGNAPADVRWAPNSGTGNFNAGRATEMFLLSGGYPSGPNVTGVGDEGNSMAPGRIRQINAEGNFEDLGAIDPNYRSNLGRTSQFIYGSQGDGGG